MMMMLRALRRFYLFVTPAKAGVRFVERIALQLDPGLRRDDGRYCHHR
jgi:hypothetical protein